MWQSMYNALINHGVDIITMGGKINPYIGLVISVILGIILVFVGFKFKNENWNSKVDASGSTIGTETNHNQDTTDEVLDGTDDWLDGKK